MFEHLFENKNNRQKKNINNKEENKRSNNEEPSNGLAKGDNKSSNNESKTKKKRTRPPKKKNSHSSDFRPTSNKRPRREEHSTKKSPPSAEAMALSAKLKDLSSRKQLQESLDLYYDKSNDPIRDGHHACIVIDCCARSGSIHEGEKVLNQLLQSNSNNGSSSSIPVPTMTALLKGYVHSGMMQKASHLYQQQLDNGVKYYRDKPNVRTLNTLLRGCLWNASSLGDAIVQKHQQYQQQHQKKKKGRSSQNHSSYEVTGGVVTCEKFWPSQQSSSSPSKHGKKSSSSNITLDYSSYEYSISLLCQALRCKEANIRLNEMKQTFGVTSSKIVDKSKNPNGSTQQSFTVDNDDPASAIETLVVSFLSLARAHFLLGEMKLAKQYARNALDAATTLTSLSKDGGGSNHPNDNSNGGGRNNNTSKGKVQMRGGGKRAWKSSSSHDTNHNQSDDQNSRRVISNSIFRAHKISELEMEASMILNGNRSSSITTSTDDNGDEISEEQDLAKELAFFLITRLLYFSGGGTTATNTSTASSTSKEKEEETTKVVNVQFELQKLLNSLWFSFGLAAALQKAFPNTKFPSPTATSQLNENDCTNILNMVLGKSTSSSSTTNILDEDGFINFNCVFSSKNNTTKKKKKKDKSPPPSRPLNIELGSGFGDWITCQAQSNPSSDYIAVELRSDRVAQTFSKAMVSGSSTSSSENTDTPPLTNLCCVASECGAFLQSRVRNGTVSKIFVNHPEPPTQTYGADENNLKSIIMDDNNNGGGSVEPGHMLNSETIVSIAQCLNETDGQLVIVTDNRWYANLICCTIVKVMKNKRGLLHTCHLGGGNANNNNVRRVEVFSPSYYLQNNKRSSREEEEEVILYEGQPSETIGHAVRNSSTSRGASYFDRLWRSGAGTHAETKKRFIIVMNRFKGQSQRGVQNKRSFHSQGGNNSRGQNETRNTMKKKPKKRSEASQKKRNERRLAKKLV